MSIEYSALYNGVLSTFEFTGKSWFATGWLFRFTYRFDIFSNQTKNTSNQILSINLEMINIQLYTIVYSIQYFNVKWLYI